MFCVRSQVAPFPRILSTSHKSGPFAQSARFSVQHFPKTDIVIIQNFNFCHLLDTDEDFVCSILQLSSEHIHSLRRSWELEWNPFQTKFRNFLRVTTFVQLSTLISCQSNALFTILSWFAKFPVLTDLAFNKTLAPRALQRSIEGATP